ncbi:HlyD family type I secretion periplasmic adaptor subunit [Novosphingobium sp. FKTRR1]|uniref:HlyD family type I secretion periplasmic adaptor subunit n=1 Tax=unclassified Novosphingobium TaxID=2644732 RepID=UPI001CF01FA7|nr:HlyD family type I secretion periplasmic adaptor subunit [Novosphingobium sp. FKTRR1]
MSLAVEWLAERVRSVRAALKADRQRQASLPKSDAPDFLPAALEVVETPVSPTYRLTAWLLMALLAVALIWSVFGRVDVVASAPGRIMPSGNSKLIQSAAYGVVSAIHVTDGAHVRRGAVLVELDTTLAGAELEQARKGLLATELDIAGNRALIDALDGKGLHFVRPEGTPPEIAATREALVAAQVHEIDNAVAGYAAARGSAQAEAQAAAATRAKFDATAPILEREVAAMNRLDRLGYAPGMRLLDLQRQHLSELGDREVAAAQERHGASEARKYAEAMAQTREQARRQALTDLAKAQADLVQKREDVTKATRRAGLQRLVAPVDGTVQQLALHTIGGVVEPARPLMVIVPDRNDIMVEARVLNRDAGFVHSGQSVSVKVDAFPFIRFGAIPGRVLSVTRDAVPDQKQGAGYVARIQLDRNAIMVDGQPVPLSAGMDVVADIRTGDRRIISWLISPVMTTIKRAAREH